MEKVSQATLRCVFEYSLGSLSKETDLMLSVSWQYGIFFSVHDQVEGKVQGW